MYNNNNGGFTVPYPSSSNSQTSSGMRTGSVSRLSSTVQNTGSATSQPKSLLHSSAARNVPNPVSGGMARKSKPISAGGAVSNRPAGLNMSRPPMSVASAQPGRISEMNSMFTAGDAVDRQGGYSTPLGGGAMETTMSAGSSNAVRKSLFTMPTVESVEKSSAKEQEKRKSRYATAYPAPKVEPRISRKKEEPKRSKLSEAKVSATAFTARAPVQEARINVESIRKNTQQEDVVMMNSSNAVMRDMDEMQNAYGENSSHRSVGVRPHNPSPASGYNSSRRAKTAGNNKLVVGSDIKLSGEISSCEELVVDGEVEANLTDTQTIEVSETGHFKGSAEVSVADISGTFEGNLTAVDNLFVRSTGRIIGNIKYTTIVVEPGGVIDGVVEIAKSA